MGRELLRAVLMGLLTVLLCLVLADGVCQLRRGCLVGGIRFFPGQAVFLLGLLGLPLLFCRRLRWRYTLVNLPLYFFLYFPAYHVFGRSAGHILLETNGWLTLGPVFNAVFTAALFWCAQSLVFLACRAVFPKGEM